MLEANTKVRQASFTYQIRIIRNIPYASLLLRLYPCVVRFINVDTSSKALLNGLCCGRFIGNAFK